jgi:hypothetical protein
MLYFSFSKLWKLANDLVYDVFALFGLMTSHKVSVVLITVILAYRFPTHKVKQTAELGFSPD